MKQSIDTKGDLHGGKRIIKTSDAIKLIDGWLPPTDVYRRFEASELNRQPDFVKQQREQGINLYLPKYDEISAQRKSVFEELGGAFCACCGYKNETHLEIDHVRGDGKLWRAAGLLGMCPETTEAQVEFSGYSTFYFQVLCKQCNMSKMQGSHCQKHGKQSTRPIPPIQLGAYMRIQPIRGSKILGTYHFFLPSKTDKHVGQWLTEEMFVAEFMRRNSVKETRCADPRCAKVFNPKREDQRYCNPGCSNRHRTREAYRTQNGLPDEKPTIQQKEDLSAVEDDLRQALDVSKMDVDLHPSPQPEQVGMSKDGKFPLFRMMGKGSNYQRDQDRRAMIKEPFNKFLWDLARRDFVFGDFWKDQINDLFAVWTTNKEQLPPDDTIRKDYLSDDRYTIRMQERAEKLRLEKEAEERAKKLTPLTMDQAAQGGTSPDSSIDPLLGALS